MRGFVIAIVALLLFGAVAGVAYEAGLAAAGAGAAGAAAAYPYWHPGFFFFPFGFLFPLLFLFLIFGLARAAFWGGRWGGYGRHWGGGPRMLDEWHRELHEREKSGTGTTGTEKGDR